jgi:gamma-glutamylcyclotransferase (GGCT)/AIG2-like uncharacterized protein YtfP
MQNVFVYGSLLFTEIAEGLCGKKLKSQDALLNGFRRCAIKDADYPAIVKNATSEVKGKVFFDVDDKSMQILNFYEGDEYEAKQFKVETSRGMITAIAFVWKAEVSRLEELDWNKKRFETEALEYYAKKVVPETLKEFKYR